MNSHSRLISICSAAFLAAGVCLWVHRAPALLPQPSFVLCGQILDPYGWPLLQYTKAEIILRVLGRECARVRCNERLGPGLNYFIEVPLDDGRRTNYAAYAARLGDALQITVDVNGREYPLMRPSSLPRIDRAGGMVFLNLNLGTDSDGDGLPDEWEEWLMSNSWGAFTSIQDIQPQDDADGDGVSNWHEFIAGTDPSWAVDRPAIEAIQYYRTTGHMGIALFSVPGKTYRVWASADLNEGLATWQQQPIVLDPSETPGKPYWTGTGYFTWLLVKPDPTNANWHVRFSVE